MFKRQLKGFTLIELLVVIAIIAILAVLIIIRIGSAAADARDARRKSDINSIRTAIEQARNKGSMTCTAIAAPTDMTASGIEGDTASAKQFMATAATDRPSNFLQGSEYPKDPITSATRYYKVSGVTASCGYTITAYKDDGTTSLATVTN